MTVGIVLAIAALAATGAVVGDFGTRDETACSHRSSVMVVLADEPTSAACGREADVRVAVAIAGIVGAPLAAFVLTRPPVLFGPRLTRAGVWVFGFGACLLAFGSLTGLLLPYRLSPSMVCDDGVPRGDHPCLSDPGLLPVALGILALGVVVAVVGAALRGRAGTSRTAAPDDVREAPTSRAP